MGYYEVYWLHASGVWYRTMFTSERSVAHAAYDRLISSVPTHAVAIELWADDVLLLEKRV